jgi:hypothetical protein
MVSFFYIIFFRFNGVFLKKRKKTEKDLPTRPGRLGRRIPLTLSGIPNLKTIAGEYEETLRRPGRVI